MKRMPGAFRLTKAEKAIDEALMRGEYIPATPEEDRQIREALSRMRKDAVLNIRISRSDLDAIKKRAKGLGVRYQTYIGEYLHRLAIR